MIASFRSLAGALALAVVTGSLLGGCSGAATSVSCSGSSCRATVNAAPVEVSEPGSDRSTRTSTRNRPPRDNDRVDFGVSAMGPGWVDVEDDGTVTRVPQGGTFVEDGSRVALESSDGKTAVFTFTRSS